MTAKKIVYVGRGDMVELRFVPDGEDRSFRAWDATARRAKALIRVWPLRIAAVSHSVQLDHGFLEESDD